MRKEGDIVREKGSCATDIAMKTGARRARLLLESHANLVTERAKAGTLGVVGVYPPNDRFFLLEAAMNKNLAVKMGNSNHRAITPALIERVRNGSFDPLHSIRGSRDG